MCALPNNKRKTCLLPEKKKRVAIRGTALFAPTYYAADLSRALMCHDSQILLITEQPCDWGSRMKNHTITLSSHGSVYMEDTNLEWEDNVFRNVLPVFWLSRLTLWFWYYQIEDNLRSNRVNKVYWILSPFFDGRIKTCSRVLMEVGVMDSSTSWCGDGPISVLVSFPRLETIL